MGGGRSIRPAAPTPCGQPSGGGRADAAPGRDRQRGAGLLWRRSATAAADPWRRLAGLIKAEPDLMLAEIQAELAGRRGITVSLATIHRHTVPARLAAPEKPLEAPRQDRPEVGRKHRFWQRRMTPPGASSSTRPRSPSTWPGARAVAHQLTAGRGHAAQALLMGCWSPQPRVRTTTTSVPRLRPSGGGVSLLIDGELPAGPMPSGIIDGLPGGTTSLLKTGRRPPGHRARGGRTPFPAILHSGLQPDRDGLLQVQGILPSMIFGTPSPRHQDVHAGRIRKLLCCCWV